MNRRHPATAILALAAILMLAGAAFAQENNTNSNSNSTSNTNTTSNTNSNRGRHNGGSMGQAAMGLSSSDRKFMIQAGAGGMAEVELARLALEKSSSDAVKRYAQQMVDDHTKNNDELMQLAQQKGVTLPAGPDPKHAALITRLRALSGAEFDRIYIREAGVKAHSQMEKLFTKESTGGRDADARGFASRTLPAVQMHLKMARDLSGGTNTNTNGNTNSGRM